jgi:hypothetical protein
MRGYNVNEMANYLNVFENNTFGVLTMAIHFELF